ncbi:S1 family peptidase [Hymenobacter coccineus]|uniref:S1 family peptidase n=1 Tax=Hymenobacter coccineus TaxID=1908235 RepID=UPI0009F74819|nr:serine protease [Hymenobacter coccineus]
MNIEKWKRAVVHLDCAADSDDMRGRYRRSQNMKQDLDAGIITQQEFEAFHQTIPGTRDIRYTGTAIFLLHNTRRYLLTARHVVWDELGAKRIIEEAEEELGNHPSKQFAQQRADANIFSIIFRVLSLDEALKGEQRLPAFLMNLGAGAPSTTPYMFSDASLDVAVISLDSRDQEFADDLIRSGYIPITTADIGLDPLREGEDVFTVGFPGATAHLGHLQAPLPVEGGQVLPGHSAWSSTIFAVPVSSFGKVSMVNQYLPFFLADMSIYPGNSGGPIIANDKLVGIVSAQPTIALEGVTDLRSRIPFGIIIHVKHAIDLLEIQEAKDKGYS